MEKMLRNKKDILLMILPVLLIFIVFVPIPVIFSTVMSFTNWKGIGSVEFIGLKNYEMLFKVDRVFKISLVNTGKWLAGGLILQLIPAFFLSLILSNKIRARGFFRSVVFMPATFSAVAVSLIWYFVYHPEMGLLNQIIRFLGFKEFEYAILQDKRFALLGILMIVAWQWIGYYTVIYISGIAGIPQDVIEAARIDGANRLQVVKNIIIPYLMPMFKVSVVLATTSAFKGFGQVFVMTGGGHTNATSLLALHMYNSAFGYLKYGYGSAISVIIMICCIVATILINKLFSRQSIGE